MSGSGTPGLSVAPGGAARGAGAWYENALVAVLSLSAGLVFLDRLGIVFVFPQIQHELALNRAQLGLLMGITSLTWALSSIVISFVSDALGGRAKPIIVICVVGFSCATGLIAITHSFAALLAARALAGLFFGPAVPLMQSRCSAPPCRRFSSSCSPPPSAGTTCFFVSPFRGSCWP